MNGREFMKVLDSGKKPVVTFHEEVENQETCLDQGMRGRAIGYREDGDGELTFYFDIKEFEPFNIDMMKPLWNDVNGVPCLKVIETNHYPKDGKEYICGNMDEAVPFSVLDESPIYREFVDSGANGSYVEWLEKKVQLTLDERMRELIIKRISNTMQQNLQGSHDEQIKGMERLVKALFGEEELAKIKNDALDDAIREGM